MKLALCLNEENFLEDIQEASIFKIYEYNDTSWDLVDSIDFSLENAESMKEIRESLKDLMGKMGDCKNIIAKKITGLFYTTFETSGFELWEMDGSENEVLENFVLEETQEQQEKDLIFVPVEKGLFEIDLIKVLQSDPNATSKNVLIPFLEDGGFNGLRVICAHVPPWFEGKLKEMKYTFSSEKIDDHYLVEIIRNIP